MQKFRRSRLLRAAFLVEGGLLALAVAMGWLFGNPHIRLRPSAVAWGAIGACPIFLLFAWATRMRWEPIRRLSRLLDGIVRSLFAEARLVDLALVSCLAGVGEEAFFRGAVQSALARWMNEWAALFAASMLFGAAHLVSPAYAVLAGLAGAYLGWLYLESDNLIVPMISHALYDFLALAYVLRRHPGRHGESAVS